MALKIDCLEKEAKCDWVGEAETKEELLAKLKEHVEKEHMKEFTERMQAYAESLIEDA